MNAIFEKYAALRAAYSDDPESLERMETEQSHVSQLLQHQEYSMLPATRELIALCRTDIISARGKLARVRHLTEDQRAALWQIIEARQWFLDLVAKDFESELTQIDQGLDAELSR